MLGIKVHLFIESMTYLWLGIAVSFLLLEMGSPGLFFFLSFFFAGLSSAAASMMASSITVQIYIFFVATIVFFIILRYGVMPFIAKNRPHERTNVYALVGKRAFAISFITEKQSGMVKINGAIWAARSVHGQINKDDEVEIIDIRGTHVMVKKII